MGTWLDGSDFDSSMPAIILSVGDENESPEEPPKDVKRQLQ